MSTIEIKDKIVNKIHSIDDSSILENVLIYLENIKNNYLSIHQLDELDKRRKNYLNGTEKTISWKEIKKDLLKNNDL